MKMNGMALAWLGPGESSDQPSTKVEQGQVNPGGGRELLIVSGISIDLPSTLPPP